MDGEPRPPDLRDAVLGGLLVLGGVWLGGAALWSLLFWPDQHLDAPRLLAWLAAWVAITAGLVMIRKWREGDWFERRRRWNGDGNGSVDPGAGSDSGSAGDTGGSGGDSGGG